MHRLCFVMVTVVVMLILYCRRNGRTVSDILTGVRGVFALKLQDDETHQRKSRLYEEVAARIALMIEEGTFRTGERIPSVRGLMRQLGVSLSTVLAAYGVLEDQGVIEARPQSGYYVRSRVPTSPLSAPSDLPSVAVVPVPLSIGSICTMLMGDPRNRDFVPLGAAIPNPDLLPVDKLTRALRSAVGRHKRQSVFYDFLPGLKSLRVQIARRAMTAGCLLSPDDIVTTQGATEAVNLCLRAVCRPGDTVAVESPTFYGFLQIIESLGLHALEIPTHPEHGLSLDALAYAMEHNRIAACLVVSNFSNPLGCSIPEEGKKALVELLANQEIPLIEDDIYGDLCFDEDRPVAAKAFDKSGLVLLCSSFSKTIAPGYRVGWVAAGRFQRQVERFKVLTSVGTSTPAQLAVAEFLSNGGYDHHLRRMRKSYRTQTSAMARAVVRHFPAGTRVSRPSGGFVLWVELPQHLDSIKLYEDALNSGITIAPGPIFSAKRKFGNFVRLNAGFWSERVEGALVTLGKLAAAQG
jgi:DNA-binding transcriptional MocR family regulator